MTKTRIIYLLILVVTFILYSFRLDLVPVHLNQDELAFSLNGYSIAKTSKDFYGNTLPFYFWHLKSLWATPVITYLTSLVFLFLPISEYTSRIPSVIVGVFNVGLLMALIYRIFRNHKLAITSGILLIITPVHFIHSRLLLDNLYTVPFILIWLYFLKLFTENQNLKWIFLSTLSLGIGIHSYHAAKVIMPFYFLITLFLVFKFNKQYFIVAFLGFLIPIIIFIPWLMKHPDTLLNQVSYIGSLDSSVDINKGIWGVFNLNRFTNILTNYITYFSPKILFTEGDMSLIHSTRIVGAFLAPIALLVVFGIIQILYHQKDIFSKIILIGLLSYPLAPSIVNDPQRISRGLVVIPFMIITAAYGLYFLIKSKEVAYKPLLNALFLISLLQFIVFYTDYFSGYRVRSYNWFNYDIGGGVESILKNSKAQSVKRVYLDGHIPFIDIYSKFYQEKLGIDIKSKEIVFDSARVNFWEFEPGAIVLVRYDHLNEANEAIGNFEKITTIREPDGKESFYVYFRDK